MPYRAEYNMQAMEELEYEPSLQQTRA